jgi:hypothetical protein
MPGHYGDKKMNGEKKMKKEEKPKAKGLTEKQKKNLPPALQKAILAKRKKM